MRHAVVDFGRGTATPAERALLRLGIQPEKAVMVPGLLPLPFAVAAWATYFAEVRGTPDASLRQLAVDLYATYDLGVNFWTSSTSFTVTPPRRYTWEYKNSASFSWALTSTDVASLAGMLRFSAPSYNVVENQGTATITVTRTGGSNVPASVNYATSNGTATAGSDYTGASGTLTFADGETSKTFIVPIIEISIPVINCWCNCRLIVRNRSSFESARPPCPFRSVCVRLIVRYRPVVSRPK